MENDQTNLKKAIDCLELLKNRVDKAKIDNAKMNEMFAKIENEMRDLNEISYLGVTMKMHKYSKK